MPFTTYTELKASLASRLHRTDLTTTIVDAVTLAEKRLNHALNLTDAEKETTLTATVASRSLTLPSDFGSPIALYLTTYLPRREVEFQLPEEMQVFDSNSTPRNWTIDGTAIKTDMPADLAYTYELRYRSEYDIATTSTNTLLTNYPDCYFYGALIELYLHLSNESKAATANLRYSEALGEAMHDTNKNRIATLGVDAALQGGYRSRITEGF